MEWMLLPYRRYAQFHGRANRREYWLFALFLFVALAVLGWLDIALGFGARETIIDVGPFGASYLYDRSGGLLTHLFALASLIPAFAVAVRRLHDSDKSGWWLLLTLIPFAGALVLLIFLCVPGTAGANRFGAQPQTL